MSLATERAAGAPANKKSAIHTRVKRIRTLVDNQDLIVANRTRLAEAAVGLFRERGFHNTSTRDIAEACGMSAGALYQYVAQKEDLLVLILQQIIHTYEEKLFPLASGTAPARQRLEEAIQVYYRLLDDNSEKVALFFHEYANLSRETKKHITENDSRVFDALLRIVEQRVQEDRVPAIDTRFLTHNIVSMGQMWSLKRSLFRGVMTLDQYIATQLGHLQKILGA